MPCCPRRLCSLLLDNCTMPALILEYAYEQVRARACTHVFAFSRACTTSKFVSARPCEQVREHAAREAELREPEAKVKSSYLHQSIDNTSCVWPGIRSAGWGDRPSKTYQHPCARDSVIPAPRPVEVHGARNLEHFVLRAGRKRACPPRRPGNRINRPLRWQPPSCQRLR